MKWNKEKGEVTKYQKKKVVARDEEDDEPVPQKKQPAKTTVSKPEPGKKQPVKRRFENESDDSSSEGGYNEKVLSKPQLVPVVDTQSKPKKDEEARAQGNKASDQVINNLKAKPNVPAKPVEKKPEKKIQYENDDSDDLGNWDD